MEYDDVGEEVPLPPILRFVDIQEDPVRIEGRFWQSPPGIRSNPSVIDMTAE